MISNLPPYSTASCIQSLGLIPVLDPFRNSQDIRFGNPLPSLGGGISHDKTLVYSFLIKCEAVECKSSINSIQYNTSVVERRRLQWTNPYCFPIANGGRHAGAAGTKDNGRSLMQKRLNELAVFGHERTIPYLKGVGKT